MLVIASRPASIPIADIVEGVLLHLVHHLLLYKLLLKSISKLLRCDQVLIGSWGCDVVSIVQ